MKKIWLVGLVALTVGLWSNLSFASPPNVTLIYAILGGHTETAKLLLDNGADVNAKKQIW